jgi:predicted GNAT superfamily acetyltransferase
MAKIREVTADKDLRACVEIEAETWGPEVQHRVDVDHLRRAVALGGILLGAFEDRRLAGFVFSYRIDVAGPGIQHSHLLAVRPSDRGRGLGRGLKLAQREAARRRGDALIVWTFDPLEAVNARLNLGRLGATARRYLVDFYGETGSPLHQGLPTDRLLAEWEVPPPGGAAPVPLHPTPGLAEGSRVIATRCTEDRLPEPADLRLGLDASILFLPIPSRIQELKRRDPGLANRWSLAVRRAFLDCFGRGSHVRGFVADGEGSDPTPPGYLLEKARTEGGLTNRLDLSTVPFSAG